MGKFVLGIEAIHTNMNKITGIERYTLLVLEALNNVEAFDKKISKIIIVSKAEFDVSAYSNLNIEFSISTADKFTYLVNSLDIDLLHCTFVPPSINIKVPVVYTLHDVGRYLYPEYMDKNLMEEHINALNSLLDKNKCTLLTVSDSSKKQIQSILNVDEQIVYFAPLYPHHGFRQKIMNLGNELPFLAANNLYSYILVVGCFIPTKNVISIIKAYKKLVSSDNSYSNVKLVIVGKEGWDYDVENISKETEGIIRLTDVSDEELYQLYKGCGAFVSASLIEGFGLPLIEAALLNAPIVCSDIPPYREILPSNDSFFSPLSITELTECIQRNFNRNVDYCQDIKKYDASFMGRKLIDCYLHTIDFLKESN